MWQKKSMFNGQMEFLILLVSVMALCLTLSSCNESASFEHLCQQSIAGHDQIDQNVIINRDNLPANAPSSNDGDDRVSQEPVQDTQPDKQDAPGVDEPVIDNPEQPQEPPQEQIPPQENPQNHVSFLQSKC